VNCLVCSGEVARAKASVVVTVIGGGKYTLEAIVTAVDEDIPVLVFAGSGGAADFIAAAYDRRERPLVLQCIYIHQVALRARKSRFSLITN